MPTLVSSACIWYSSQHRRWLTPDEALVLQGFPVRITHSLGEAACSFAVRHEYDVADSEGRQSLRDLHGDSASTALGIRPTRPHIFKMAGNSMHTNVSGVVVLFALTQIRIDGALLKMLQQHTMIKRRRLQIKQGL